MDGVLIDSELHWKNDEKSFIQAMIPNWNDQDHKGIIGLSIQDIYHKLVRDYQIPMDLDTFLGEIEAIAQVIYGEQANLLPGVHDLIRTFKEDGHLVGVASSSRRHWIEMVLGRHGLLPLLDTVVSFEDLPEGSKGKPAPDIYLHAAKQLAVAPGVCTVFEDADHGISSAKSAGMHVIGIRNGFNDAQTLMDADEVIEGFEGFTLLRSSS